MGFGTIFATIALFMIIGVTSYFAFTSAIFSVDTLSHSLKVANGKQNERIKTEIEIVDISVDDAQEINVTINNSGHTKILKSEFKHMDVFVYYDVTGAAEGYVFKWVPYTEELPPENDHWTVVDIAPDSINPGIFDPDEQMRIWIRVFPRIELGTTGWLKVVTPNGVSASKYFNV